jgi:hypothetical protein
LTNRASASWVDVKQIAGRSAECQADFVLKNNSFKVAIADLSSLRELD